MEEKTFVQLCPNCGSPKFHVENDVSAITGVSGIYVCDKCGFQSKVFPEVSIDKIGTFQKDTKKERIKEKVKKTVLTPFNIIIWIIIILAALFLFSVIGIFILILVVIGVILSIFRRKN